jgi:hypothetical protein
VPTTTESRPSPGDRIKLVAPPNLSGQLFKEGVKPLPAHGLTSAGLFRQKDLHEMGRRAAHEALRARALPGQLSRSVSVVTVSICSPKRFR